ncbi:hypothetical protein MD484_g7071, partial [Candolleomyces efflorescens]
MQPETTLLPFPTLTSPNGEVSQPSYLHASVPLKVEEIFEETKGRDLSDVLSDAVRRVSMSSDNGELQSKIEQGGVKCRLAPCYGSLNKARNPSSKRMDDATIVMLWVTLKNLSYAKSYELKELDFDEVIEIFKKNPFIEQDRSKDIDLIDELALEKAQFWKFSTNGEKKKAFRRDISKRLRFWFNRVVAEKDVLATTKPDIPFDEIEGILSRMSSDCKPGLDYGKSMEKAFFDFGVLRFPDIERPYIKQLQVSPSSPQVAHSGMNDLDSIFGAEPMAGLEHLSKAFQLQQVINLSAKDKAGYSVLVPEIKLQSVSSLAEPERIASFGLLATLSAMPSSARVVGTIENHPAATIAWDTLQHTLSQATYLQNDRTSPPAPQSWEAVDRAAHWFQGGAHAAPDSRVVQQASINHDSQKSADSLV